LLFLRSFSMVRSRRVFGRGVEHKLGPVRGFCPRRNACGSSLLRLRRRVNPSGFAAVGVFLSPPAKPHQRANGRPLSYPVGSSFNTRSNGSDLGPVAVRRTRARLWVRQWKFVSNDSTKRGNGFPDHVRANIYPVAGAHTDALAPADNGAAEPSAVEYPDSCATHGNPNNDGADPPPNALPDVFPHNRASLE